MSRARGIATWRVIVIVLLLALATAAAIVWSDWQRFRRGSLAVPDAGLTLEIPRGTGFNAIVEMLRKRGLSAAPALYWRALAERMGVTGRLHAGEYALQSGMTPAALLERLARGDVLQHHFTVIEGWSFRQLRAALAEVPDIEHATRDMSDAAIMSALGHAGVHPEGRFLPETYAFVKGDSDLLVLGRAFRAMDQALAEAWAGRAEHLPVETPQAALILASIIEKETGRADERERIAGVFTRRLRIGMPLATDPTIIYGLGADFDGNLRRRDLEADGPYNTYRRAGLPPTPIAMPGRAALHAALHPADGKELYFVARGDGSGAHVFSATLVEHNRAVNCHQRKRCK